MIYQFIRIIEGIKVRRINFSLLASVLLISCLSAQYRADRFQHLTVNDGLTQNTIHCIVQDDLGFMWFGSEDGLNKYDGYQVWPFRNKPGDSTSIADNFILSMIKDSEGMIWIGTESGHLIKCDPNLDQFTNYGDVTHGYSIQTMIVVGNHLWLGTRGDGIVDFSVREKTSKVIRRTEGGLPDNEIRILFKDSSNRIWVGTHHGGVSVISINKDSSLNYHNYSADPNNKTSLSWNEISMISEDQSGTIWVGTIKSLDRLNEEEGSFLHYGFVEKSHELYSVNGMIQSDDSHFIVSFQNQGLARFDRETGQFVRIVHNPGDPQSLSYNAVNTLYKGSNNLIWVATWGGGVDWFNPNPTFVHYAYNPSEPNSLADPSVRAILEDDTGNLWVGSYGGLDRYNRDQQTHVHFSKDDNALSNLNVYSLAIKSPYLWIGTEGGGLDAYNSESGQFLHFAHEDSTATGNNYIFSITPVSEEVLCLGSFIGIELFDTQNMRFIPVQFKNNQFRELKYQQVTALLMDGNNDLWVGTAESGLYRLLLDGNTVVSGVHFVKTLKPGLNNSRIKCIYKDRSNRMWIGTNGGGVNLYHPENQSFTYLTEANGLPNNVVYGILEDEAGELWISTNKGLSNYQPTTERFINYAYKNGLQGNEFNTNSYYMAKDGRMYFGGIQGISAFYPKDVKHSGKSLNIRFTDLHISSRQVRVGEKYWGMVILRNPIFATSKMKLEYRIDQFNIEFSTLSYIESDLIQYQYKMEGLDQNWSGSRGDRPFATYTHLPPGEYVLKVRAKLQNSTPFGTPAELAIIVPAPFYLTGWAILVYIVVVLGLFIAVTRRQLKKQKSELKRQQELVKQLQRIDALKQETINNQEKYETLFRQSMDAIFICTGSGQLIDINPSWIHLLGYSESDLSHLNLFDLFTDNSKVRDFTNQVFKDGFIRDFEVFLKAKKETTIVVLITASVIRGQSDEIISIQGIIRDITLEREAQEEIRRLSHGIESAGEMIMMTDLSGIIIYANPAFYTLTGFTPAEAVGNKPRILKSGKHNQAFYEEMWTALLDGKIWTGVVINKRKNGQEYNASMTIAPVKNEQESVVGFVAIQTDITRRIRMEEALRTSEANYKYLAQKLLTVQDEERERISRDIHDSLGQYLATLAVHTDLNINKLKDIAPDVSLSMQEAKDLIKNAIDECRRLSYELNPLTLQKLGLVQAVNELVRNVNDRSNLNIIFNKKMPDLRLKPVIEVTIYRVIQEALSNIMKYAKAKQVKISLSMNEGIIDLSIADDGVGLEQSQSEHSGETISGFGMLNMRERVNQCHGKFHIQSEPNKGVTIQISIPVENANA